MAKPIKETPILKSLDAQKFMLALEKPVKVIDKAERERMKANFSKLKAISNF